MEIMRRMTDFPYSARLKKVQHDGVLYGEGYRPSSRQSPFSRFVTLIGALARRNDQRSERDLDALMADRDGQAVDRHARTEPHEPTRSSSQTTGRSPPATPTTSVATTDADIPRYTMALKEYGDSSGHWPLYEFSGLMLDPPLFKARVLVNDQSFDETAAIKKAGKALGFSTSLPIFRHYSMKMSIPCVFSH